MMTSYDIQRETVARATKRYITALRKASPIDEQHIESVQTWLKELEEESDLLSFLKLCNLLKIYKIRKITVSELCSDCMPIFEELARHTDTLDEITVTEEELTLTVFKEFIQTLKLFKLIKLIRFSGFWSMRLTTDFLNLLSEAPIRSLSMRADGVFRDVAQLIGTDATFKEMYLQFREQYIDISELICMLKRNKALKVGSITLLNGY
jgi:hypothetical protein